MGSSEELSVFHTNILEKGEADFADGRSRFRDHSLNQQPAVNCIVFAALDAARLLLF